MRRLVSKPFWRVNVERWGYDENESGYFSGTETFLSGSSTPHLTERKALDAALLELKRGSWVKIEKHENEGGSNG